MKNFERPHTKAAIPPNTFYKLRNKSNGKVACISAGAKDPTNMFVYPEGESDDQKWLFFPIDGGKYVIANKSNGKVACISAGAKDPTNMFVYPLGSSTDQHWISETVTNEYIKLRNESNGKVACISAGAKDPTNMFVYPSVAADDQQWTLIPSGSFTLPETPTLQTLDPVPQYTKPDQVMPDKTDDKLVAWTLIPSIMVNDGSWGEAEKLATSPYYILEKIQHWKLLENLSILPGETNENNLSYGVTDTVQKEIKDTLGFSISQEGGMNFKVSDDIGLTSSIKWQMTNELQMTYSTTHTEMTTIEVKDKVENPFQTTLVYAKYILVTQLVLKRVASNPADANTIVTTWSYTDPNKIIATAYPSVPPKKNDN